MYQEIYTSRAVEIGASKAALLTRDQVVTSADFRSICEGNGCGLYHKCWMCPPFIGPIETLIEKINGFTHALLYQSIHTIEDSFDIEGMTEAGRCHALLSQKLRNELEPLFPGETLHLSCGGCNLCERCACRDEQPCRFPEKALSSMEGYGIDVYKTCKNSPLAYINGPDTVTYFGIIFFNAQ